MEECCDIFLGGTCNESTWRDEFIRLMEEKEVPLTCFNPVVDDWNTEAQLKENFEKDNCTFNVFCITPLMNGVYSIAEIMELSSRKRNVMLIVLKEDNGILFTESQKKSLEATMNLFKNNGFIFKTLEDAVDCIKITYKYILEVRNLLCNDVESIIDDYYDLW
jgi:hypothetical protein